MTADHWLFRLDAAAWLRAAAVELAAGDAHLGSRRTAVTHARRAAGMALNAALCAHADATGDADAAAARWGRSYVDHLRALADAADDADRLAPLPPRCAALARDLLAVPVVPPAGLVQLSRGPEAAARDALALARALVDAVALALDLAPASPGHDDPADDPR